MVHQWASGMVKHRCDGECLFQFEVLGVEEDLNPHKCGLLDNSCVLHFSTHNTEAVLTGRISFGFGMVIDGKGNFEMFFEPFPICSCGFSNILFITLYPVMCKPLNHLTFLCDGVHVLGETRRFLMMFPPLK